ncbi:hypothetical protein ACGF07_34330 [Kitasatospora sp. NPDC048194]|uniref:hypothetical protein n=1 Tax=Kitasatospora sp. NPDC048194 TaxID=3364045 RepID=UPI0037165A44
MRPAAGSLTVATTGLVLLTPSTPAPEWLRAVEAEMAAAHTPLLGILPDVADTERSREALDQIAARLAGALGENPAAASRPLPKDTARPGEAPDV